MKSVLQRAFGRHRRVDEVRNTPNPWSAAELQTKFPDLTEKQRAIMESVQHATMTSPERIQAFCQAIEHVIQMKIRGDIVECGVWRGGSMSAAAQTALQHGTSDRDLWLYDTFAGMSEPSGLDADFLGRPANELLNQENPDDGHSIWCKSGLTEVQGTMRDSGYPESRIHYVVGKVEDTLPTNRPASIAVLRLDTDWYDSTRCELEQLYPRLVPGGILIIDDYGHWDGCRRAVDEYFQANHIDMFLQRIDYTGRMGIKR